LVIVKLAVHRTQVLGTTE